MFSMFYCLLCLVCVVVLFSIVLYFVWCSCILCCILFGFV